MNKLNKTEILIKLWQLEGYRLLPLSVLFKRLKQLNIHLDSISFITYADECDSPEDLTNLLVTDQHFSLIHENQIYLLVFELWRRLMGEKPSLSIICNELDYQIHLYDHQQLKNPLALQETLNRFIRILNENADYGIPVSKAIKLISSYCVNDIETFLYNFIFEQIDEGNEVYASALLDDFDIYLKNNKWFKLLNIRLCKHIYSNKARKLIEEVIEDHLDKSDIAYHLEFLSILAERENDTIFQLVLKQILPFVKREEDFQDLLSIIIDHFHRLGQKQQELILKTMLEKRSLLPPNQKLMTQDVDLITLIQLFNYKKS